MSTISKPAARLEHAGDVVQGTFRFRQVVQHERQRRRIEPPIIDWKRFELAAPQLHVIERLQPFLRRLQHRRGGVHCHDALDERRKRGRHLSGPAAEIADGPLCIGKRRQRGKMKLARRTARRAVDPIVPPKTRKIPGISIAALPAPSGLGVGPARRPASARPVRERAPRAAERRDRGRHASSRTDCWFLRRAPRSSRCRRGP